MTKKIEYMKHKLRFKIGSILHSFYVGDMTYTEALGQILKAFDWHCTTCNTVQEEKEQHANRDKTKTWEEELFNLWEQGATWRKVEAFIKERFIDRQELEKEIEELRRNNKASCMSCNEYGLALDDILRLIRKDNHE